MLSKGSGAVGIVWIRSSPEETVVFDAYVIHPLSLPLKSFPLWFSSWRSPLR